MTSVPPNLEKNISLSDIANQRSTYDTQPLDRENACIVLRGVVVPIRRSTAFMLPGGAGKIHKPIIPHLHYSLSVLCVQHETRPDRDSYIPDQKQYEKRAIPSEKAKRKIESFFVGES